MAICLSLVNIRTSCTVILARKYVSITFYVSGYEVKGFLDGASMLAELENGMPKLIMLDIMLPGEDGLSILKKLRADERTKRIPIMMVTAKTTELDKVRGLDMGADDYLVKPISIDELSLRLQAIARRLVPDQEADVLSCSGVVVNIDKQTVRRNGQPIDLTPKERKLLVYLMRNKGRCLSYDSIADHVWGPIDSVGSVVSANVSRLRKKLAAGGAEEVIHTVRDVGYVFK